MYPSWCTPHLQEVYVVSYFRVAVAESSFAESFFFFFPASSYMAPSHLQWLFKALAFLGVGVKVGNWGFNCLPVVENGLCFFLFLPLLDDFVYFFRKIRGKCWFFAIMLKPFQSCPVRDTGKDGIWQWLGMSHGMADSKEGIPNTSVARSVSYSDLFPHFRWHLNCCTVFLI